MFRKITNELMHWKNRVDHKPLIIRGARQIGKTFVVNEFAKENFTGFISINLEERNDLHEVFTSKNPEKIRNELSVLFNQKTEPGKTLLFLDEIQACPDALVALRYFYENMKSLHVIAAGSLLEHVLADQNFSMPVGRVEFMNMFPMSFEEYLMARNEKMLLDFYYGFSIKDNFPESLHKRSIDLLNEYNMVGGMPEAVDVFIKTHDFFEVERIQNNIITAFQFDFSKYGNKNQQEYLRLVFNYMGKNIGKKIKFTNIDGEIRSYLLKDALKKLEQSRIITLVRHTNAGTVPLPVGVKENFYKPVFLDIGLLNRISGIKLIKPAELLSAFQGMLAEQFIGQELLCNFTNFADPKLFYWSRESKNSNAEVDYIIQIANKVYPVEVKSGKSGSLKSLQVYIAEKGLTSGIRFNLDSPSVGRFENTVCLKDKTLNMNYELVSLPLYLCFLIEKLIVSG